MPHYYFSEEGTDPLRDDDGEELSDDAAARAVAEKTAQELREGTSLFNGSRIIVRDESGKLICEVAIN